MGRKTTPVGSSCSRSVCWFCKQSHVNKYFGSKRLISWQISQGFVAENLLQTLFWRFRRHYYCITVQQRSLQVLFHLDTLIFFLLITLSVAKPTYKQNKHITRCTKMQQENIKISTNVGFHEVQKASHVRTLMIYEAFSVLVQYSSWQLAKPLIMWCVSCSSHGADPLSLIIFMSAPSGLRQRIKLYIKMMGIFFDQALWV